MNHEIFNSVVNAVAGDKPKQRSLTLITSPYGANAVRDSLHKMDLEQFSDHFCDMGDMSESMMAKTAEIISNLSESNLHIPLYITSREDADVDLSLITSAISPVFIANAPVHTDEFHHIGLQRHYTGPLFDIDSSRHIRLGTIKTDIQSAEVILRSADLVSIDLSVLRRADNLGSISSTTAGLSIEELCLIAKYAGASTHLKNIVIKGYNRDKDHYGMMAENVALVSWYLLEGYMIRQKELNSADTIKQYTVFTEDLEHQLLFSQNARTDRWWVSIHSDDAEQVVEFACSKNDYEAACQNRISERILSLLAKV